MSSKILYVANSSLSISTGGGRTRIISAANQASKSGFSVITACFFPPHTAVVNFKHLYKGKISLASELGGKVFYFPRLPLTRFGWVSAINDWYCGILLFFLCLFTRIRILHCHTVDSAQYALKAKLINSKLKIAADIHGAVAEEYMYERDLREPDKLAKRLEACESSVLNNSDWLVFVSAAMQEYYENKYQAVYKRATVIPCATKVAGKNTNGSRDKLRSSLNLTDSVVFCYIGSGEAYQLPDKMCAFFKSALEVFPNAFLLILSHHREVFQEQLSKLGIGRSHYKIQSVPHSEVFNVLQMGDIGFLLRDDSIVNKVSSPTKFGEYCLSGLPVLTTEWVGDISGIVREHKLGAIVQLDDLRVDTNLAEFIKDVRANRSGYSERCSQYVKEQFSWEVFGEQLGKVYTSLGT